MILVACTNPRRRTEAERSAKILGAELLFARKHTITNCTKIMGQFLPTVVVTHRMDDVHPDHRGTASVVLAAIPDAVIKKGVPSRLYTCDSYESLTVNGVVPGRVIVDVSAVFAQKLRALECHRSQPLEHFLPMAKRLGAMWGARIGVQWAEAFDPVPILGRLPGAVEL